MDAKSKVCLSTQTIPKTRLMYTCTHTAADILHKLPYSHWLVYLLLLAHLTEVATGYVRSTTSSSAGDP